MQSNSAICRPQECVKKPKAYPTILNAQPGAQWMDHGGYCGSWLIQRIAMTKAAYNSQQQVCLHAFPGGGNDEEILATNIDEASCNLELKLDRFDYNNLQKYPMPQANAYRTCMKQKLAA